jgi:hypothetical protein
MLPFNFMRNKSPVKPLFNITAAFLKIDHQVVVARLISDHTRHLQLEGLGTLVRQETIGIKAVNYSVGEW